MARGRCLDRVSTNIDSSVIIIIITMWSGWWVSPSFNTIIDNPIQTTWGRITVLGRLVRWDLFSVQFSCSIMLSQGDVVPRLLGHGNQNGKSQIVSKWKSLEFLEFSKFPLLRFVKVNTIWHWRDGQDRINLLPRIKTEMSCREISRLVRSASLSPPTSYIQRIISDNAKFALRAFQLLSYASTGDQFFSD